MEEFFFKIIFHLVTVTHVELRKVNKRTVKNHENLPSIHTAKILRSH